MAQDLSGHRSPGDQQALQHVTEAARKLDALAVRYPHDADLKASLAHLRNAQPPPATHFIVT